MSKKNLNNTKEALATAEQLVLEFRGYTKKSASNHIEMGRIVYAARQLGNKGYGKFCEKVGMKSDSSSIRKLKSIGEKYAVFSQYADQLPCNWTTLYDLSRIETTKLEEHFKSGEINALMTGNDAKRLAPPTKSKPKSVQNGTVVISRKLSISIPEHFDINKMIEVKLLLKKLTDLNVHVESIQMLDDMYPQNDDQVDLVA